MLPINCGSHTDYQNIVVSNLRKYYPDPNSIARSTWDIIDRFWNLNLSFTDSYMQSKYSKYGPAPRTPCFISFCINLYLIINLKTIWYFTHFIFSPS